MKKSKLPDTDSIQKLAEFWDSHDLTDFEGELVEITRPVFKRGRTIQVPLGSTEFAALGRLARSKGVSREELVRSWVKERITAKNAGSARKSA